MKRRIALLTLLATTAIALTACGSEANSNEYVKIGEYKGLEVTVAPKIEVTDADVEAYIKEALRGQKIYEEVAGRPVQNGDKVNIDYIGKKDGVAFEGGSSPEGGYDLEIGSGKFIAGFEDGLVGAEKGAKLDLNLTFPENYVNADMAGQAVVFSVTVNTIQEGRIPELTDEIVPTLAPECKNVAEYKEYVLAVMQDKANFNYEEEVEKETLNKLMEGHEVSDPPQEMVDFYVEKTKENADTYAAYYGMNREEFITQYFKSTVEEFEKETKAGSIQSAKEELVIRGIAKKEKIKVSKDELNKFANENMKYYGYDSPEALLEGIGEEAVEYFLLNEKVMKVLTDSAVITTQKAEEAPATEAPATQEAEPVTEAPAETEVSTEE